MRIIIGHLAAQPIKSEDDKVNEFIFIHLGYFLSSFTAASASATGFSKKILQLLYDLLDIINYYFSTIWTELKLICNVHIPIVYLRSQTSTWPSSVLRHQFVTRTLMTWKGGDTPLLVRDWTVTSSFQHPLWGQGIAKTAWSLQLILEYVHFQSA